MFRLPSEKEEHKTTIGALILSIFIIIAGIGGMIYTKHESSEFKNSTDVRTLHATVYSCEQTKEKDDKGDRKEKYKVRFTYEIDGTTYDDFDTYYKEIRKGEIGKLLRIDFRRISSVPKWSWNDWMRDEERSGGVGMDLSIHDIDFAQSVLGLPEEVSCIYRPLKDNSSYIISALKYKDAVVTCEGAWYNADIPFSAEFYAYFDDGYIYFKDGTLIKNGEKIELQNSVGGEDFGINISGDDAYQSEIRYFIDCILTGKEPERVTPESSAESIKLVRKLLENTIFKI